MTLSGRQRIRFMALVMFETSALFQVRYIMSLVLTICCEYRISLSDFVQLDEERDELAEMLRLMVDRRFSYVIQNKTGKTAS